MFITKRKRNNNNDDGFGPAACERPHKSRVH